MMHQHDRYKCNCLPHANCCSTLFVADLLAQSLLNHGNLLHHSACHSMQHSLVLSALFPTTWMSEEFLFAAQSVWRMQHEGMLCFSFSIMTQLLFLKNESSVHSIFFLHVLSHLTVFQQFCYVTYFVAFSMQFTSIPCENRNPSCLYDPPTPVLYLQLHLNINLLEIALLYCHYQPHCEERQHY